MHPRDNVWEYQARHDFVADLRAIDPRPGAPIATYESMHDMRTAFAVTRMSCRDDWRHEGFVT